MMRMISLIYGYVMLCKHMKRVRTTVFLDETILNLVQGQSLNVSEICRAALEEVAGVTSPAEMMHKAKTLRIEAQALETKAVEIESDEDRLKNLKLQFHQANRRMHTERENLDWLVHIRKKHGFKRVPVKDLLEEMMR